MSALRQEDDVIASSRMAWTAIAAVAVALAAVFCAGLLLRTNTGAIRQHEVPRDGGRTIANLEQTPILVARDGLDLRAQQRAELSRVHWLDRDAGVAAIPIERAMGLVEKESR